MNSLTRMIAATLLTLGLGSTAKAQVVNLLVGNSSNFSGVDRYSEIDGTYQGVFAGPGTVSLSYQYLSYGPDSNLYVGTLISSNQVLKFDGHTGNFISTFVSTSGGNFTFGTAGDLFRIEQGDTTVVRRNGTTGQLIGTFSTGLTGAGALHFGPGGDLFVNSLNGIRRFNGITGASLGDFVLPGAGGLTGVTDFVFVPGGNLLVSGGSGGANDKILQYDPVTGAFIGVFTQGNGLNLPKGMTLGPDGNLYVASGSNSILKFDATSGSFLGPFVPMTAHGSPTYLTFTPFPVPEPSSIILGSLAAAWSAIALRFRTSRHRPSLESICSQRT